MTEIKKKNMEKVSDFKKLIEMDDEHERWIQSAKLTEKEKTEERLKRWVQFSILDENGNSKIVKSTIAKDSKAFEIYENNGYFNKADVFEITGKGCPKLLRETICNQLGLDPKEYKYFGMALIIDFYESIEGMTYVSVKSFKREGNPIYELYELDKVPFELRMKKLVDRRYLHPFELIKQTESKLLKPMKRFKKSINISQTISNVINQINTACQHQESDQLRLGF